MSAPAPSTPPAHAPPDRRLTLAGLVGSREGGAPVRDRLTSMLFLAAIAHAILILGISFGVSGRHDAPPGMEVLLVSEDLPEARSNEHAAYLAQRTQLGAGNTHTLPTGSPAESRGGEQASDEGEDPATPPSSLQAGEQNVVGTSAPSPLIQWLGQTGTANLPPSVAALAAAGSDVHGRGDARELVLHGDPRTGQWLSPDTRASRLAPYLNAWRQKVERVGTLNYPSAARRAELSGSPVVEVAIGADGRLLEAAVQRSSGHPQIDAAALQILRLASPFEPFPKGLARDYGVLRFAYQWEFVAGEVGGGAVTASTDGSKGP